MINGAWFIVRKSVRVGLHYPVGRGLEVEVSGFKGKVEGLGVNGRDSGVRGLGVRE